MYKVPSYGRLESPSEILFWFPRKKLAYSILDPWELFQLSGDIDIPLVIVF